MKKGKLPPKFKLKQLMYLKFWTFPDMLTSECVRICGRPLVSICAGERRWMIFSTVSTRQHRNSFRRELIHIFLANCILDVHQREGLEAKSPREQRNSVMEWRPGLMFHFQQLEAFPATTVTPTTCWGVLMLGKWMNPSVPGYLCFPSSKCFSKVRGFLFDWLILIL